MPSAKRMFPLLPGDGVEDDGGAGALAVRPARIRAMTGLVRGRNVPDTPPPALAHNSLAAIHNSQPLPGEGACLSNCKALAGGALGEWTWGGTLLASRDGVWPFGAPT